LVTASGPEALTNGMTESRTAYDAAQRIEDAGERRRAVAVASRDMRYFADRLRTAQLVPPPAEFSAVIAHLRLPVTHRLRQDDQPARTAVRRGAAKAQNHPQRLRRKAGAQPDVRCAIRAAERWRGLRFTEFELRQIAAVRKELDQEYEDSITPLARSSQPRVSSKSAP
jgi:hypothetical protein